MAAGLWFTDLGSFVPFFTVAPSPINTSATTTVALTGTGTVWDGTTVFTLSGLAGASLVSTNVLTNTAALLVISTGATPGTITITESVTGTAVGTVGVTTPAIVTFNNWRLGRPGGAGGTGERRLGRPMLK